MKFSKFLKRVSSLALIVALVLSFAIPSFGEAASTNSTTTVHLMADASTRYSLGERQTNGEYPTDTLLNGFENQHDIKVNVTYDNSGNLVNQMIGDSTGSADVFLSGGLERMDEAVNEDIIHGNTVYHLLKNELVLVANESTGLTSLSYSGVPDWLAGASDRTIAIGDPDIVPVGTYTKEILGTAWDSILAYATLYGNATNVLNAVVTNDNPIGSVYATDAKQTNLTVLAREDVDIIYPIGITTVAMGEKDRKLAAQELVDFLKADIAKPDGSDGSVFKAFGFNAAEVTRNNILFAVLIIAAVVVVAGILFFRDLRVKKKTS